MRLVLAALALLAASPGEPTGWGGENPFSCVLQQAGLEAEVPDPGADPYCVEFDKTRQNVTELGVVDFLSKEPARVAAASDKCFYFQSDHWRGSVVQDDGSTKTYEWDGHYFYDKATGDGGAWVTNFNVNGRTQDPSQVPGMPPEYARHMGPGTGGVITRNQVEADPACAARASAEPERVYSRPPGTPAPGDPRGCVDASGFAGIRLGMRDGDVRAKLGDPAVMRRGIKRWCAIGGGELLVGEPGDRSGEAGGDPQAPTVLVASTSRRAWVGRFRVGARVRKRPRRSLGRAGRTRFYVAGGSRFIGVRSGRVVIAGTTARRGKQALSLARRANAAN